MTKTQRTGWLLAILAGTLLPCGAVLAQASDAGSATPGPVVSPDEPVVLSPSGFDLDDPLGLGHGEADIGTSDLLADGAYLSRWSGRLVESAPDLWVFAFDSHADGTTPGPVMPVLPGQRLVEMQQMVRDRGGDVTFRVSGHATIFGGRNYFLPRVVTTITRSAVPAGASGSEGRRTGEGAVSDDPSVEELLARVREAAPPTEVLLRTRQADGGAGSEDHRLVSEGVSVMSAVGRMIRRDEGFVEFVLDNGVEGEGAMDGAVVLMPCLLTEEIARLVDERGDRVMFSLSGEVFVYGGRNYLMPVLYRIEPRDRWNGVRPGR